MALAAVKRVILVGDSIRLDYQPWVAAGLADVATVTGPAENGGDSRNLLAHLDDWVIRQAPDIVHLNCGLHDIKRERGAGNCAVSLGEYADNVDEILARLQRETGAVLAWATTTPVIDARHAAHKTFDRRLADVVAYNAVAVRVAAARGVVVNDLYGVVVGAGAEALLSYDGIHFTADGKRMLGSAVAGFLSPLAGNRVQPA